MSNIGMRGIYGHFNIGPTQLNWNRSELFHNEKISDSFWEILRQTRTEPELYPVRTEARIVRFLQGEAKHTSANPEEAACSNRPTPSDTAT